ncbi:succinyl-diaminopimelate desuccinylase [Schaalia sp. lx-260]|uniref:succinyl-diaminopimelate desuccinylase n=1 Tax=Schaalia sp. lx-260 TaxID=2899082 RepID=UPI001E58995D|nr:succinyl-diaminopimelate desuccinylase [Schaalia sp. lx-260]MCD4549072.1 succinyl-diaminopimelate desuccinylase [Schaalia sp. lx-260]
MTYQLTADDPVTLTAQLIDIPSVSGQEKQIADAVEQLLRTCGHLEVLRDGDAVLARTHQGASERVIIAGHVDTVPIADNVPHQRLTYEGNDYLVGRGSVDMLGGVAMALYAAVHVRNPRYDVTWIFYDNEEVAAELNGLGRIERNHPDWLDAEFAILGEPTDARIEGGCNGTVRIRADFSGKAAHSARSWTGDNAIHKTAPIIASLASYGNPEVDVDGLAYKESLSVVRIEGGIAGNVVPDKASVWVNYRFAPSRTPEEAVERVCEYFAGSGAHICVEDVAVGARPGMHMPIAQDFVSAVSSVASVYHGYSCDIVGPKYGWTDVARFAARGVPALNYGPGDPLLAHTREERVQVAQIRQCAHTLASWLGHKS